MEFADHFGFTWTLLLPIRGRHWLECWVGHMILTGGGLAWIYWHQWNQVARTLMYPTARQGGKCSLAALSGKRREIVWKITSQCLLKSLLLLSSRWNQPILRWFSPCINQINKDQTQRTNIKSSKGKTTINPQGDPHKDNSWSFNRNFRPEGNGRTYLKWWKRKTYNPDYCTQQRSHSNMKEKSKALQISKSWENWAPPNQLFNKC